jgi:hypothetical protein
MTANDVDVMVRRDIGEQWARSNLHHVDLRRCLLPARAIQVVDPAGANARPVWLVLHEVPGGGDGYGVVFDELTATYGLVEMRKGYDPCLIGLYGTFFDTLERCKRHGMAARHAGRTLRHAVGLECEAAQQGDEADKA